MMHIGRSCDGQRTLGPKALPATCCKLHLQYPTCATRRKPSHSAVLMVQGLFFVDIFQVQAVAVDKHGSLQSIEEEKQRRMDGKLEQRLHKRQAAEKEEDRQRRRREHLQATIARYSQAPASSPQEGAGLC